MSYLLNLVLKGILGSQPSNLPEVVTKTGEACGTIRLMRVASWPILPLGGCWLLQRLLGKLHSTQAFPRTPSANTGTCSDTHDTPLRPCITHPYLRSFFLLCFIPAKAMFRLELPEQPQCWVLNSSTPVRLKVPLAPVLDNLRIGHCLSTQNPFFKQSVAAQLRTWGIDRLGLQYGLSL